MVFKKKKSNNSNKVEPASVDEESNEESAPKSAGANRGISKLDLVMRIVAAIGTLGSALAVGTANNNGSSAPFFTEFIRFGAGYDDLPTFTFFVVANSIACGYLLLSLALSIFHILKSSARVTRVISIILDTVMMAYLTGGASSAAAMVHLAHEGNSGGGAAVCQHYNNSFCGRVAGALVGSFIGVIVLLLLISLSAVALSRH